MAPDQGQDDSFHLVAEEFATNDLIPIVGSEHRHAVDGSFQPDPTNAFGRRAWLDLG